MQLLCSSHWHQRASPFLTEEDRSIHNCRSACVFLIIYESETIMLSRLLRARYLFFREARSFLLTPFTASQISIISRDIYLLPPLCSVTRFLSLRYVLSFIYVFINTDFLVFTCSISQRYLTFHRWPVFPSPSVSADVATSSRNKPQDLSIRHELVARWIGRPSFNKQDAGAPEGLCTLLKRPWARYWIPASSGVQLRAASNDLLTAPWRGKTLMSNLVSY